MWVKKEFNDKCFLLKYDCSENNIITIFLTDLMNIWQEKLDLTEIIERCQKQNPLINTSEENYKKHVESLFSETKDIQCTINVVNDQENHIQFVKNISDVNFNMEFRLKICNQNILFEKVTVPMVEDLVLLKQSQKQLLDVIKEKETELKEFRRCGYEIANRNLKSAMFDGKTYTEKINLNFSEHFENDNEFVKTFLNSISKIKDVDKLRTGLTTQKKQSDLLKKKLQKSKYKYNLKNKKAE